MASYEVVAIQGLRRSEHRGVVLLESDEDSRVDALGTFRELPAKTEREIRTRMDTWIEGAQHNNRWFHGFRHPDFRDCFVFKWRQKNRNHRLYGFLINPCPSHRPRFRLCVLTNHAEKPQWETDTSELWIANLLRIDLRVHAAIRMMFADHALGAAPWTN